MKERINNGNDVAVIGMSCRLHGTSNYNQLWSNLIQGKSFIAKEPQGRGRWDVLNYFKDRFGQTINVKCLGNFIEDIESFDAQFFNLSNREVEGMDPQQRMLLELTWSCLEDACTKTVDMKNSKVGVYVASFFNEYRELLSQKIDDIKPHHITGSAPSLLANRISYQFNLSGPSIQLDTACSGSLTALHLACKSIEAGECDMAFVAAVNLMLSPINYISFTQMGMLSPTGSCKTFDDSADGYARGEGAAVLLLKPLKKAQEDGDIIHGIIKGSAINHGGKVRSITFPSEISQSELIVEAVKNSGIEPESINYIEAHGTGTPKGDPIEFEGLRLAFSKLSENKNHELFNHQCGLGSIKSNVGHLEAAAGLVGVIKVLLSMKNKQLPQLAGYKNLNKRINLQDTPFFIVNKNRKWDNAIIDGNVKPRRAGVSSFGFGGSNGHVILEEAPSVIEHLPQTSGYHLICLSAKSEEALLVKKRELLSWLDTQYQDEHLVEDIEWSLAVGREHFQFRTCIICDSIESLVKGLSESDESDYITICASNHPNVSRKITKVNNIKTIEQLMADIKSYTYNDAEYCVYLEEIAKIYLNAKTIEWDWKDILLAKGKKISLPTYPFKKQRFKIPFMKINLKSSMNRIHPLIHNNESTFKKQCYTSRLTSSETILSNLAFEEVQMFSMGILLEIAYAAFSHSMDSASDGLFVLHDISSTVPLMHDLGDYKLITNIGELNSDRFSLTIKDEDYDQCSFSCKVFMSKDGLSDHEEMSTHRRYFESVNMQQIKDENYLDELIHKGISVSAENAYVRIMEYNENSYMIDYDVEEVNETEYKFKPALLDYILQIISEKENSLFAVGSKVYISMNRLQVYKQCTNKGKIIVSNIEETNSYNVFFYDEENNINSIIYGLEIDIYKNSDYLSKDNNVIMNFRWKRFNPIISGCKYLENILFIGNDSVIKDRFAEVYKNIETVTLEELDTNIDQVINSHMTYTNIDNIVWVTYNNEHEKVNLLNEQEYGIYLFYRFLKKLVEYGFNKKDLCFTVLTCNNQKVIDEDIVKASNSGFAGLIGVTTKEFSRWKLKLIDYGKDSVPSVCNIMEIKPNEKGNDMAYRNNAWYEKTLISSIDENLPSPVFKQNGVYVIIGGAGGIGTILTSYLIEKYNAQIVWIGRRTVDEDISNKIKKCSKKDIVPFYVSADATHWESLCKAYEVIMGKYSTISGVFHSAVGSLDKSIIDMSLSEYREVVRVKVDGAVNMVNIFSNSKPDFMVFFSSIASMQKFGGQSGYASGCNFLDMYAYQATYEFGIPVKSINWGLWENIGIAEKMSSSAKIKIELSGILSVNPDKAMGGLEKMIASKEVESLYMKTKYDFDKDLCFSTYKDNGKLAELNSDINELACKVSNLSPASLDNQTVKIIRENPTPKNMDKLNLNSLLDEVVMFLRKLTSSEVRIPLKSIDATAQLENYGLDSIMIIHLTDELKKYFEGIESTVFYECTSIEELAKLIVNQYPESTKQLFGKEIEAQESEAVSVCLEENGSKVNPGLEIKMALKTDVFSRNDEMKIAIVGMSGRFPMAGNLTEFWDNLKNGKDCISEIPKNRWEIDGFFESDVEKAIDNNCSYSKWGGFLENFENFDSLFFGISPREAMNMDPQERLCLEESYKAFQDAGYTRNRLHKKFKGNVGVFIGVTRTGFEWYGQQLDDKEKGIRPITSFSSMANRISYFFNFNGPSMSIDTMCSSSLTAVHIACDSIRSGQCKMALVGGVNVYTHPSTYKYLCQMNMLSKTGRCHTFGANADGFVPGEGVCAIIIKPLDDAIRDRDNIYSVIRSTNINHGGKTNGYFIPNANAQRDLVRGSIEKASIDARMISYFEAHGTGTKLGDPLEISGLTKAFSVDTSDKQFCTISSVKANIGHLEGAAGIAGVIKTVLQMKHKSLVPHINANELNPRINFKDSPFLVNREFIKWKRPMINVNGYTKEIPRIAGVSAFGAGGANANVILEEFIEE